LLAFLCGIPVRIGFANAPLSFLYTQTVKFDPAHHEVQRNLGLLTATLPEVNLEPVLRLVSPTANELDKGLCGVIPRAGTYAMLVPGSTWPTKMWHWRGYREVARYPLSRGIPVILDGAPGHHELNEKVGHGLAARNLAGRTSVADAMYLIRHAAVVVCNDSMALHMASAYKVPCVAVFCATSPENGFGPWRSPAVVVQNDTLTCRPCGRHGGRNCPTGTEACCRDIDAGTVIRAIQTLLAH
jgi:heptosyltransferase-2